MAAIKDIEIEIDLWLEQEDFKWKQRAKREWYKGGDKNTKYYHACASQRRRNNRIKSVKNHLDFLVSSQARIEDAFKIHFQQVFSTSSPSDQNILKGSQKVEGKVTSGMNQFFSENYTKEEVLTELKQMAPLKSSGPDGFNPNFYQSYWHIVGDEVTSVVLKFFNDGTFDHYTNFTYIVLISKIKNPVNVSDFRPISLCNVIYKLVSKVLVNRLKQIPLTLFPRLRVLLSLVDSFLIILLWRMRHFIP